MLRGLTSADNCHHLGRVPPEAALLGLRPHADAAHGAGRMRAHGDDFLRAADSESELPAASAQSAAAAHGVERGA